MCQEIQAQSLHSFVVTWDARIVELNFKAYCAILGLEEVGEKGNKPNQTVYPCLGFPDCGIHL